MSQGNPAKNWCFTINNPIQNDVEKLDMVSETIGEDIKYLIIGRETGEEGTPHIQGYIQFSKKKRFGQVRNILGKRAHIEIARGTAFENATYCKKDDHYTEYGRLVQSGQRNDLESFKEKVKAGLTREEVIEECSEVYAKYPRFCDEYQKLILEKNVRRADFEPREGWQTILSNELLGEADSRKIIWYCDSIGNVGKSYFANHFTAKGTYVINGGKAADIYYAYYYEPIIIFDLARQKEDIVAYDVMENFKNGYFLSTKYQVKRVKFNIPHVVVFANFMPDQSKLSADRWDIRVL